MTPTPTPTPTYADLARLSADLTPATAEQWCDARGVSLEEALAVWTAARGDAERAQRVWEHEAWWRGALCRICNRPLSAPYRSHNESGAITHGCVAIDHDGHLAPGSADLAWHERPAAKLLRDREARSRANILGN
jgi:hypothetical protein